MVHQSVDDMDVQVITVYRNAEGSRCPKRVVINRKQVRSFETLLDNITECLRSKVAIRSVRTPTTGRIVTHLDQIEHGATYVAQGQEKFVRPGFLDPVTGQILQQSSRKQRRKARPNRLPEINSRPGNVHSVLIAPSSRVIFLYKNGDDKDAAMRLLLHHSELTSLDNVLQHLSEKVKLRSGAVRCLYTLDGLRVRHVDQLIHSHCYVGAGQEKRFLRVAYRQPDSSDTSPTRSKIQQNTRSKVDSDDIKMSVAQPLGRIESGMVPTTGALLASNAPTAGLKPSRLSLGVHEDRVTSNSGDSPSSQTVRSGPGTWQAQPTISVQPARRETREGPRMRPPRASFERDSLETTRPTELLRDRIPVATYHQADLTAELPYHRKRKDARFTRVLDMDELEAQEVPEDVGLFFEDIKVDRPIDLMPLYEVDEEFSSAMLPRNHLVHG